MIGVSIPNGAVARLRARRSRSLQVLPICVGGLGVREGLLAFFLHSLGVPTGQAVAVGLLWYAMTLIVSLARRAARSAPSATSHPDGGRVGATRAARP